MTHIVDFPSTSPLFVEVEEVSRESARISQGIIDVLRELKVSDIKTHQYNQDIFINLQYYYPM